MAITCPENQTYAVCSLMEEAGAGLGVFIEYIARALPILLLILVVVTVVSAVGMAVAKRIEQGFNWKHR
jgi:hypothetical protein